MQPMEPTSVSSQNVGFSSLSLFSTSVLDEVKSQRISIEPLAKKQPEKHRFGLSRVKNATKCAAKKFNQMFSKAKLRLIKPSLKYSGDISIMSSTTQMTDIDATYEFDELSMNDITRFSSRTTIMIDEPGQRYTESNRMSNCSFDSTMRSSTSSASLSSVSIISLNESNLMHQILAQSIADLNVICANNVTQAPVAIDVKKPPYRKGTPYKLKMPQRLTLYEKNVSLPNFDANDSNGSLLQANNAPNPLETDVDDGNVENQRETIPTEKLVEEETQPPAKERLALHFDPGARKASIAKRIAKVYCNFYNKFVSKPIKYDILQAKTFQVDQSAIQLHKNKRRKFALIFNR